MIQKKVFLILKQMILKNGESNYWSCWNTKWMKSTYSSLNLGYEINNKRS